MRVTPQGLLKIENKRAIITEIFNNGAISRADLAITLNSTKTTISKNVKELIDNEVLIEIGKGNNTVGKKSMLLDFNEEVFNYIFINLVGNDFQMYIVNIKFEVLINIELNNINKYDLNETIEMAILQSGKKIKHAILSIPAVVKDDDIFANNTIYKDLFFRLTNLFKTNDITLSVVNDMDLLGEFINYSDNEKSKNSIVIGSNYGLGSSIFIDKVLYKGENNFAGEIAFMNPQINNGNVETMEHRCSIIGMLGMYSRDTGKQLNVEELVALALNKDNVIQGYIEDMITEVAGTINNLSYSFDIQNFYLYGLLFELNQDIVSKINERVKLISNRNIQINHFKLNGNILSGTRLHVLEEILKLI